MKIAIAGFGAAGGASALLLARQGHDVTVFEQAAELKPVGAGVLLQPSGQMALAKMGILDEVIAKAEPIERLVGYKKNGDLLDDLPYVEINPGCRAYGLHRADLFEVLHPAAVASGVKFRWGCRIGSTRTHDQRVTLFDEKDTELGTFDFLLACDGLRSILRAQSKIPMWSYRYRNGVLWVLGRSEAVRHALHQNTWGARILCGLLPMGQGRCTLFWSMHEKNIPAWKEQPLEAWKKEVLSVAPKAEELLAGVRHHEEVRFTTYQHVVMSTWYRDRTLFLGDAGHAFSPHTGQGLNLALIDAWVFAQSLKSHGEFQAACAAYTRRRASHLRFYSLLTCGLAPFFQSGSAILGWGRDLALPYLQQVPLLRRQMLLAMAGVKTGLLFGQMKEDYFSDDA